MEMFDYIRYRGNQYQTKNLPTLILDNYELREDDTLWHENYDAEWDENSGMFGGNLLKKNVRWEPENFTGIIRFYRSVGNDDWEEYEATLTEGKLLNIIEI